MSTFTFPASGIICRFVLAKLRILVTLLLIVGALVTYSQLRNIYLDLPVDVEWKEWIEIPKESFVRTAINSAVEDDYDSTHIRAMCDAQPWDSSLIFDCWGIIGGIGNAHSHLTCFTTNNY